MDCCHFHRTQNSASASKPFSKHGHREMSHYLFTLKSMLHTNLECSWLSLAFSAPYWVLRVWRRHKTQNHAHYGNSKRSHARYQRQDECWLSEMTTEAQCYLFCVSRAQYFVFMLLSRFFLLIVANALLLLCCCVVIKFWTRYKFSDVMGRKTPRKQSSNLLVWIFFR